MGRASQELEESRLRFGAFAHNYQEAMDGLYQIAHQFNLTDGPDEILCHLVSMLDAFEVSGPESPLEDRLVPLTEEDVQVLGEYGSFRLLDRDSVKPIIKDLEVIEISSNSYFRNFYDDVSNKLTVFDLCPERDDSKPRMRLIAIKEISSEAERTIEFPWNVGWVTEGELESFSQEVFIVNQRPII